MEYRMLGASGFSVPVLSLGTGTFGGSDDFFKAWGNSTVSEATRLVDICLEAGLNMFDSADVYSARCGGRDPGPGDQRPPAAGDRLHQGRVPQRPRTERVGSSRIHLVQAVERSLRRLGTDYIDLFQIHGFDALTPVEETLQTLDQLVVAGKVRYIGCSNFSGWHLMKSLAASERAGWGCYVAHQVYYSLIGRDYEWELMPLALDQRVGCLVWSPLGWGRLTGKITRGQPVPRTSRLQSQAVVETGPQVADEYLFTVVDSARSGCARERQDGPTGGAQLAPAETDDFERDHRRAERGSIASESGRGWLDADSGAGPGTE